MSANFRGALWMLNAAFCFGISEALIKMAGARLDSLQIGFFRAGLAALLILPIVMRKGVRGLGTGRPFAHVLRSFAGYSSMLCNFYALVHLPLALAVSLSFTRPLFVVLTAAAVLGERLGTRRLMVTLLGFAGVLIMVRPGGGGFGFAAILGILGAMIGAVVAMMIKKLSATEPPERIMFYFSITATILSLPPALAVWIEPTASEYAVLAGSTLLASLGQYSIIRAYRNAEVSAVEPMDYSRIVIASILGFALFGEFPDLWTLLGASVIIACTFTVARMAASAKTPAALKGEQP